MRHSPADNNKSSYEADLAINVYNKERPKWAEQIVYERYFANPGEILDLGCGTGRTSVELAKRGHKVTAVDYSESMIQEAKKQHGDLGINFLVMDAQKLEFADNSFDYVFFSFNGLDYLYPNMSREMALREIFRVLKPGGIFAFSSHNALFIPDSASRALVQAKSFVRGWIYPYRIEFHKFGRLYTRYISPISQIHQLSSIGFRFRELLSRKGKRLFTISFRDPYPMYLCEKAR